MRFINLDGHIVKNQCIGWRDFNDRDRDRKNFDRAIGCDAKNWRAIGH